MKFGKVRFVIPMLVARLLAREGAVGEVRRESTIELSAYAQVAREEIFLSDLLPDLPPNSTSSSLRNFAAKIALGRAPQPGSRRSLDGGLLRERLAQALEPDAGEYSFKVPERIVVSRKSVGIEEDSVREVVWRFLKPPGSPDGDGVPKTFALSPNTNVASVTKPRLEVMSAESITSRKAWQLRLRCRDAAECKPFMVELPWEQVGGREALSRELSIKPPRGKQPGRSPSPSQSGGRLRTGSTALLVFDDPGLRFTLAVVCLEGGGEGARIHTLDRIHHRRYLGEVLANGQLRAIESADPQF